MAGDYFNIWDTVNAVNQRGQAERQIGLAERQDLRAAEEDARKKAEYEYATETRKGLGSLLAGPSGEGGGVTTVQKPNPAARAFDLQKAGGEILAGALPSRAEAMDQQPRAEVMNAGPSLASMLPKDELPPIAQRPPETLATQVQAPGGGRIDRYNRAADYLASRGDWKGMEGIEKAIDLSGKIDKRHQEILTNISKGITDRKKAGWDINSNRRQAVNDINALNQQAGRMIMDPNEIANVDFNEAGFVTKDLGGGKLLVMVEQDNGVTKPMLVDVAANDINRLKAENQRRNVENQSESNRIALLKLNPRVMRDLKAAEASGTQLGQDTIKGLDDYYNAQDSIKLLDEAESIFNKDPSNIVGWSANLRSKLAAIDPALEEALNAGDKNYFGRVMMNNADTFKKLLGPQISNTDAELMFKLAGATATTPAELKATFRTLRKRNEDTIKRHEQKASILTGVSPMAGEAAGGAPLTPYSGMAPGVNQGAPQGGYQPQQTAPAVGTGAPMTRQQVADIVKAEAAGMKPNTSKKLDIKGRKGTLTRKKDGSVNFTFD